MTYAFSVEDQGDDSNVSGQLTPTGGGDPMESALLAEGTRYHYGYNRIQSTTSHSTEGSMFSVPTRGWDSPSASFVSTPIRGSRIPRGVPRPNLCFMCNNPGLVFSDCLQLPREVREQAAHNRALYYKNSPTPQVDLKVTPTPGLGTTPIARKSYTAAVVASPPSEVAVIKEDLIIYPLQGNPWNRPLWWRQTKTTQKTLRGACRGYCHPLFGLE
jgi:hypothetical protein